MSFDSNLLAGEKILVQPEFNRAVKNPDLGWATIAGCLVLLGIGAALSGKAVAGGVFFAGIGAVWLIKMFSSYQHEVETANAFDLAVTNKRILIRHGGGKDLRVDYIPMRAFTGYETLDDGTVRLRAGREYVDIPSLVDPTELTRPLEAIICR